MKEKDDCLLNKLNMRNIISFDNDNDKFSIDGITK